MPQNDKENRNEQKAPQNGLIFALDIGTRTVVGIVGEQDGENQDNFVLTDYVVEPHTKRAMIDGQIEDIKQVAKVVARVKERLEQNSGVELSRVSIAAAGRALHTRQVVMDFDISGYDIITRDIVKSMELETVHKAQNELDSIHNGERKQKTSFYCVGHSVMRYALDDYNMIALEGHKGEKATVELIATFLPNVVVEGLYSVMDANKLKVESLTLEPIAAMNVVVPQEIRLINIALVDIGAGTSDIAISRDGAIVAYAMATTAGDEITEEIIRSYFVDFASAESMKQASTSGAKEFEYRDIFGFTQKVKTEDFLKKLNSAIDNLVETVCANITAVNGSSPAAAFLVGGGALIGGLAKKVANKLGLDENRVAIGSNNILRSVDTRGREMGAEFITPIGIAVTSILNRGYDFSLINLNDEKVRIFDTKKLVVFDILTMAGYKSYDIMGRSGRNLAFTFNGKRRTIKGGNLIPSEIYINGKPASINSGASQGDSITFIPAKSGENARASLEEIAADFPPRGFVAFDGKTYEIGAEFTVNGETVSRDYEIQPNDNIEVQGTVTLDDLMKSLEAEAESYTVNGSPEDGSYILHGGDIVDYEYGRNKEVSGTRIKHLNELISAENITSTEDATFAEDISAVAYNPDVANNPAAEEWSEITINFNGNDIMLPPNKDQTPHTFLELLNYIELDTENPKGNYAMLLGGEEASFSTQLRDGDIAVLKWE